MVGKLAYSFTLFRTNSDSLWLSMTAAMHSSYSRLMSASISLYAVEWLMILSKAALKQNFYLICVAVVASFISAQPR